MRPLLDLRDSKLSLPSPSLRNLVPSDRIRGTQLPGWSKACGGTERCSKPRNIVNKQRFEESWACSDSIGCVHHRWLSIRTSFCRRERSKIWCCSPTALGNPSTLVLASIGWTFPANFQKVSVAYRSLPTVSTLLFCRCCNSSVACPSEAFQGKLGTNDSTAFGRKSWKVPEVQCNLFRPAFLASRH